MLTICLNMKISPYISFCCCNFSPLIMSWSDADEDDLLCAATMPHHISTPSTPSKAVAKLTKSKVKSLQFILLKGVYVFLMS